MLKSRSLLPLALRGDANRYRENYRPGRLESCLDFEVFSSNSKRRLLIYPRQGKNATMLKKNGRLLNAKKRPI